MNSFEGFEMPASPKSRDNSLENKDDRNCAEEPNLETGETADTDSVFLNGEEQEEVVKKDDTLKEIEYISKQTDSKNIEEKEEISIPQRIRDRIVGKIFKMLNSGNNSNTAPGTAENILVEVGIEPDSPIFNRLITQTELLLEINAKDTRIRNRKIEKEIERCRTEERELGQKIKRESTTNVQEDIWGDKEESSKESVKRNKNDIKWAEKTKGFIRKNRDNPEEIERFWEGFERIYRKKTISKGRDFDFMDHKKMKNGILCELAAENLFMEWDEYVAKRKESGRREKPALDIKFSLIKATPEEDATKKIDFFVSFEHKGETIILPVQVKSHYSKTGSERQASFSREHICNFLKPKEKREADELSRELSKFFKANPQGIFITLSHGYDKMNISGSGEPSDKIKELFYEKLEKELSIFLIRRENIEEQNKK